jgi:predicted metal-dependent hydrolase
MGAKVSGNKVSLVYNPRLLLMDNERLDYILAHELVHIVTSNSINNVTLNIATKEE